MLFGLFATACGAQAPAGKLTYCSYSNAGAAGLGKDYCELIADIGQTPKVVVALNLDNRFGTPEIHAEYPVDQAVVDSLQAKLAEAKVYKLNGYNVDEAMTGGRTYRIYQEYSSGAKVNARWYGHHIKEEAVSSYYMIEAFSSPGAKGRSRRTTLSCHLKSSPSGRQASALTVSYFWPGKVPRE